MLTASDADQDRRASTEVRLCPACESPALTIAGSVSVRFDVRLQGPDRDLVVAGEAIGEDGWELGNTATCPVCGWTGTVADVLPLARLRS